MNNSYFVLYANCIPVHGKKRSVICDLHKNRLKLIPNDLYNILISFEKRTLAEIKTNFNNEYDDIIDDYFEFLTENDFGFYTNNPDSFPKLETKWSTPLQITNSIIDIDVNSNFDIVDIIKQIDLLGCKHVQIRVFSKFPFETIDEVNRYLEETESCIISIDFILKFNEEIKIEMLNEILLRYPRTASIIIYSSPYKKIASSLKNKLNNLIFTKEKLHSHFSCGIVNSNNFSINIKSFTESLDYNSCLNKKISIDVDGNIKNCPSMLHSFGNVKDTTLQEALNHKVFKKYWNITKDQIDVCKDCEFRYICTDCRAYIESPEDQYSKPLKCGYDPHTNKWEEWSTNPLKQKAIEYYGMKELVKNG